MSAIYDKGNRAKRNGYKNCGMGEDGREITIDGTIYQCPCP